MAWRASGLTLQVQQRECDAFTGDIATVAKLDVKDGPVRFVRYEPLTTGEQVPQSRPDSASVSDSYGAGLD
jgi:hypothetical protein